MIDSTKRVTLDEVLELSGVEDQRVFAWEQWVVKGKGVQVTLDVDFDEKTHKYKEIHIFIGR
jgi:hypothetical protein